MRVLVVEDEVLLAEQVKNHLTQQQFSVDVSHDGADGFFKISEYPYDLAIIDIGLPKMDGLALIRRAFVIAAHDAVAHPIAEIARLFARADAVIEPARQIAGDRNCGGCWQFPVATRPVAEFARSRRTHDGVAGRTKSGG